MTLQTNTKQKEILDYNNLGKVLSALKNNLYSVRNTNQVTFPFDVDKSRTVFLSGFSKTEASQARFIKLTSKTNVVYAYSLKDIIDLKELHPLITDIRVAKLGYFENGESCLIKIYSSFINVNHEINNVHIPFFGRSLSFYDCLRGELKVNFNNSINDANIKTIIALAKFLLTKNNEEFLAIISQQELDVLRCLLFQSPQIQSVLAETISLSEIDNSDSSRLSKKYNNLIIITLTPPPFFFCWFYSNYRD